MAGDQGMQTLTFLFAFIAVLALIGVAAWLVRRFATNRLGANPNRGRMPRLAVIDAAAVDGRRRLVLVRRDNVEHLLMIGGPTDIVVEPNIVRATPARDQMPRPAAVAGGEPPRIAPLPDAAWSDGDGARPDSRADMFDHAEPPLAEPPRPARPSFADELRRPAAPPPPERRIDPLAGFTPEPPGGRAEPLSPRLARPEPMIPRPPRASEPPKAPPVRGPAPERSAAPPPPIPQHTAADAAAVHRRPESRRDGAAAGGSAPPPGRRNGRAAGCARNAGRPPPAQRDSRRAARAAEERL